MRIISVFKVLGSVSVGSGVSYGGFELYHLLYPKTLREILEKEGVQLLATENNDEEWEKIWNAYTNMSDSKTLKQWCGAELKKTNNKDAKQQVTEYCSLAGIKNVSQIISYSKKAQITKDEMKDEDYQLVFLIYTSKFVEEDNSKLSLIDWLQKSDSELTEEKITGATTLKEKGDFVKKACQKIEDELEKQKDNEEYESIYWWCTKIENKEFFKANTIDKRIKYVDKEWKLADDWKKVCEDWSDKKIPDGEAIITFIEKAVNAGIMNDLLQTDEKEKFKNFCEKEEIKNKKIIDIKEPYDSQGNLYILYKTICKKRT